MKRILQVCLCVMLCVMLMVCAALPVLAQDVPDSLRFLYLANSGYDPDDILMLAKVFNDLSGIEINIDYVEYADVLKKLTNAGSTYDVIALDHIWLADLASKEMILPLDSFISKKMKSDLVPVTLRAFQYHGKTWAFPYLTNIQLLYSNQQMLDKITVLTPPLTLNEMVTQMKELQAQGVVTYPWVDAWKEDENLISEFLWLTAAYGGKLFDRNGLPVFDQGPGVKALTFMVMLIKERFADPNILTYDEVAAANEFISGRAAFTSNWLFQAGMLNDPQISDIVGAGTITELPVSDQATQANLTVGAFQGLAISAQSQKKDLAWRWITFFTSPLVQRAFRFEMPIWKSIQTSPDATTLDPLMPLKRTQLENAFPRPNILRYAEVSRILQHALYTALEGKSTPTDALTKAKLDIDALMTTTP